MFYFGSVSRFNLFLLKENLKKKEYKLKTISSFDKIPSWGRSKRYYKRIFRIKKMERSDSIPSYREKHIACVAK